MPPEQRQLEKLYDAARKLGGSSPRGSSPLRRACPSDLSEGLKSSCSRRMATKTVGVRGTHGKRDYLGRGIGVVFLHHFLDHCLDHCLKCIVLSQTGARALERAVIMPYYEGKVRKVRIRRVGPFSRIIPRQSSWKL